MSECAKVNYLMGGVNADLTEILYPKDIPTAERFLQEVKLLDEAKAIAQAKRGTRTVASIAPVNDQCGRRGTWQSTGKASGRPARESSASEPTGEEQRQQPRGNPKQEDELRRMNGEIDEAVRRRNALRKEMGISSGDRNAGGDRSGQGNGWDDQGHPICHTCKETGHLMRDCHRNDGRPSRRGGGREVVRDLNGEEEEED
jgi:hypothetical protein